MFVVYICFISFLVSQKKINKIFYIDSINLLFLYSSSQLQEIAQNNSRTKYHLMLFFNMLLYTKVYAYAVAYPLFWLHQVWPDYFQGLYTHDHMLSHVVSYWFAMLCCTSRSWLHETQYEQL